MKAVVLDYSVPSVELVHVPDAYVHTEEVEAYLMTRGFKLANIFWMSVPDDSYIPVCDRENGGNILITL